jgi:hypothetical protein
MTTCAGENRYGLPPTRSGESKTLWLTTSPSLSDGLPAEGFKSRAILENMERQCEGLWIQLPAASSLKLIVER